MNDKINLTIIVGTTRDGSTSLKVAKYIKQIASEYSDFAITFVDPKKFLSGEGVLNDGSTKYPEYTSIVENSDAFLIVTPEYNHSFPGSLKVLLDSEYANYSRKAVAFAGLSSGPWGGVRAVESLVLATRKLNLVPIIPDIYFPKVQDSFNENGEIIDNSTDEIVKKTLDSLLWMAKTLKAGRNIN